MPNVAETINRLARAALASRGESASAAAVARLIGESDSEWSLYRNGRRSPGSAKVEGWVTELAAHGIDASLALRADGWSALGGTKEDA